MKAVWGTVGDLRKKSVQKSNTSANSPRINDKSRDGGKLAWKKKQCIFRPSSTSKSNGAYLR